MKSINLIFSVLLVSLFISCSVEPEPIQYGKDQCNYCKMNVVDQQHAAQYVTKKGKQKKFDAIECMVRHLASPDIQESELAYILVADYNQPGTLVDATQATYVITKAIKSPMGANLTGFKEKIKAQEVLDTAQGSQYNWDEIKAHLTN